jgi:hypothetical protein
LTERAVHDWEKKYPHDTQIPKTIYLLQRLYTKVLTQEARTQARTTANWLFADFGKSAQARQLKKTLAVEHLAPLPTASVKPSDPPVDSTVPIASPASSDAPASRGTLASPAPASPGPSITPAPPNVSTVN